MVASRRGFTIVELLIVIVVIAILAAISVVAYTGIQNRARDTAIAQSISQYVRGLQLYATENNSYGQNGAVNQVACLDGRTGCWINANTTQTQLVSTALRTVMGESLPRVPERHALNYSTADGYYIAFNVASVDSACPTISGTTFMYTTTSGEGRTCRVKLPPLN